MREQLRLRVLIPVAVLGLLGAGFGAFAMGGPSEPESIPIRPTSSAAVDTGAVDTGTVDTGMVDTGPAPEPAPAPAPAPAGAGEVDPATWAQQANALCAQARQDIDDLGRFESPSEAKEWFAAAGEILGTFKTDFVALGWPSGQQLAAADVQAGWAEGVLWVDQVRKALAAEDADKLIKLAKETPAETATAKKFNATLRELGADECARSAPTDSAPIRASAALQWQLLKYRAVVVVFYAPDSDLDGAAVVEARAAALDTKAGFVPVDVTNEKQVAAIAIGYEVTGSPTVLVVTRGPKLRSEFKGIVDRKTVAQAVTNALK
jgi:hypothetical protein